MINLLAERNTEITMTHSSTHMRLTINGPDECCTIYLNKGELSYLTDSLAQIRDELEE